MSYTSKHGREGSSQIMVGIVELDHWLWVEKKDLETPQGFFLDDSKDSGSVI